MNKIVASGIGAIAAIALAGCSMSASPTLDQSDPRIAPPDQSIGQNAMEIVWQQTSSSDRAVLCDGFNTAPMEMASIVVTSSDYMVTTGEVLNFFAKKC